MYLLSCWYTRKVSRGYSYLHPSNDLNSRPGTSFPRGDLIWRPPGLKCLRKCKYTHGSFQKRRTDSQLTNSYSSLPFDRTKLIAAGILSGMEGARGIRAWRWYVPLGQEKLPCWITALDVNVHLGSSISRYSGFLYFVAFRFHMLLVSTLSLPFPLA